MDKPIKRVKENTGLIQEGQDAGEIRKPHNEKTGTTMLPVSKTLSDIGITKKESSTFQQIAKIPQSGNT